MTAPTIGPRSRPFSSLLQCRCRRRQWLLGLVVVSSMFAVNSSRLVCSALRLLSTLAESTLMFRAFPLLSATARAIIPRAARHASTRTRTLFVYVSVSYSLHLRQWMVARGLARSAKRLQRRSEDGREITAHHRLVVREREGWFD